MTRPRLLDLFCCEGGAAKGYHDAGFDVVGVDLVNQRRYPYEFVKADAIEFALKHGHEFDAIHASPPCQAYSVTRHTHDRVHPMLVEPTRSALEASGLPYVIENVVGAPLLDPIILCGTMFDLTAPDKDGTVLWLRRHRLFESNVPLSAPIPCQCSEYRKRPGHWCGGVYGGGSPDRRHAREVRRGGYTPGKSVRGALLGVDWMTLHGQSQSIPPAYTRWLGGQLLSLLTKESAVA